MQLLLVEDDDAIAVPLVQGLARFGMTAHRVATGAQALAAAAPDMVLLDLGLPDIDGVDLCWALRRAHHDVPIIMVTARRTEADLVRGLEGGADDYVAKPFRIRELVARIRAVDRRTRGSGATTGPVPAEAAQEFGRLRIDHAARQVSVAGVPVALAPREYDLLVSLAARGGAVVLRPALLDSVWASVPGASGKTLDFHVASLRRKLGDPAWIETRRGVGYRLVALD
ncbi:response regulator transcription factor [Paractinoplanes bogorensis]|uniref:response regulator transcription factor n=1 Tax=Paractinoplanes bogorensis TaxID=1610840 RepID=UPI003F690B68